MSPAYAHALKVANGDLIRITVTDKATDQNNNPVKRQLVIAALISPGHADNSITISLGYGRKQTGPVGEEAGFNAYLLRTPNNPHYIVADGQAIDNVTVEKVAGTYALSITQDHWSIEGRGLVREATIDGYREDNEFVQKIAGDDEEPDPLPSLYTHPPLTADAAMGDVGRSECLHRLQRVRHRLPKREQHSDRRQTSGRPRSRDALDTDRSLLRERAAIQRRQARIPIRPRDGARADDVSALRKCALRNGLSGQRDHSQRRRLERDGLQPLHRHAVLREQLSVQSASLQFLRLQSAADWQKENCRRAQRLQRILWSADARRGRPTS